MKAIYIGFAGLACSFIYRIPQMYKIIKTKSSKDISPWMLHIQSISYIFYIIYASQIWDIVNIISGSISIAQNFMVFFLYLYFSKTDQKPAQVGEP